MKKLAIIFLAMVMLFSMAVPAFATTLTITDSSNRTYAGYQLLTLTTSVKADDNCEEGTAHTDACYNYAYSVNEDYRAILQAETFSNWNGEDKPADATAVTDAQILAFLAGLSSDTDGTPGSLRPVADSIYRAIQEENIKADAANLTGTDDEIAQGYWLIADVTDLSEDNDANSLVMVDTKGQTSITINPKTALPTVEKKVLDINDSTDGDITDNAWQDSADHDIGDDVSFKLTATLPSNIASYESYQLIFHDTLSAGLTLKADTIKVYMYKNAADALAESDATDVTANFTPPKTQDCDCTFEVGCTDILVITGVTKDTVFVVTYDATLNENAEIGAAGNPNEVYLEFSNDPYSDGTGKTEEDTVIVFTYQVIINKIDGATQEELEGAGFILYKKNDAGVYEAIGDEQKGGTTFTWTGLDDGDYKLEEKTVPAGYNKMADIEFTITAEHDEESDNPALTALDGGTLSTGVVATGAIERDIENRTGTILPETGAEGTLWLIGSCSVLALMAAVFMITRKKMSVYED